MSWEASWVQTILEETLGMGAPGEEGARCSQTRSECQLLLRSENLGWEMGLQLLQGNVASHLSDNSCRRRRNEELINEKGVEQLQPRAMLGGAQS